MAIRVSCRTEEAVRDLCRTATLRCRDRLGDGFEAEVTNVGEFDSEVGGEAKDGKLASEEEAVAFGEGVDTEAYAQAPYVAVGDNDAANEVVASLAGCLHAENLAQ